MYVEHLHGEEEVDFSVHGSLQAIHVFSEEFLE